jgi:replicative DNA helicase
MTEAEKFLNENNLHFRKTDTHYQINCPLCTDSRERLGIKIELSEDKKEDHYWGCYNCSSSGKKISTLAKAMGVLRKLNRKEFVEYKDDEKVKLDQDLGKKAEEALRENRDTIKYLIQERKLSKACIKHFRLGHRSDFEDSEGGTYDAGPHLAIPYYEGEKLVNIKYRALDPDVDKKFKWRREKGGKTALFNSDCLNDMEYDTVYIAEAEIDAMSLWTAGHRNVVSSTAGAKAFKQEWYDRLQRFEKIYLCLDNDKDGRIGSLKLAKRLGLNRCYNVTLPDNVKDLNEFFKTNTIAEFNALAQKATLFPVENVINLRTSLKDRVRRMENGEEPDEGIEWASKNLRKVSSKLKPGNLIIIAAKPKVGKTTFAMNQLLQWAKQGISSFNYQCEMDEEDLEDKYVRMDYNGVIPNLKLYEEGTPEYEEARAELVRVYKASTYTLPTKHLFSYHPKIDELEIEKVCEKITEVVQRFGCQVAVVDNLHFLCRGDNAKEKLEVATRAFKSLAGTLGIVIICITHPRKTNHNRALTNDDLKDSASIFQDADLVVLLHRKYLEGDVLPDEEGEEEDSEGTLDPLCEFKITSRRDKGGKTYMAFLGDRALFKDQGATYSDKISELVSESKKKKKTSKNDM